jgi:HK97 family phage major capsid protein
VETKELLDSLKGEWEELKGALDERDAEVKSHGEVLGETAEKIDKINSAIEEIELRFEKLTLAPPPVAKGHDAPEVKAFTNWCRDPRTALKEDAEPGMLIISQEDAAAVITPPQFIEELLMIAYLRDPIMGLVRTRQTSNVSLMYPTKESRAGVVWDGEDADTADFSKRTGKASYGKGEIKVYGAHAVADIEAASLEDPQIDLAADLMADWAYNFGEADGLAIYMGDKTYQPTGMLTHSEVETLYCGVSGVGNTPNGLTYEVLADAVAALKPTYAPNARFVMNRLTVSQVRTIKNPAGYYVWQPGLDIGNPGTILGFPYVLSERVDKVDAAAPMVGDLPIPVIFGDFNTAYWLVQRIDVQIQRDPYTVWPHVRFKARKRVGGDLVMPEAVKFIANGAAPAPGGVS